MLDHAVRECWRANDRAASALGCLELAADEVRKLLREGENPVLSSALKALARAQATADALEKQAESVRADLDDLARRYA